jgi:hypothetical protein
MYSQLNFCKYPESLSEAGATRIVADMVFGDARTENFAVGHIPTGLTRPPSSQDHRAPCWDGPTHMQVHKPYPAIR